MGGKTKTIESNANERTAEMLRAFQDELGATMDVVNSVILPNELAQLGASQAVSPEYAALQRDILDTTGRDLNRIGSEIDRQNAIEQAKTDQILLQEYAPAIAAANQEVLKQLDPEFYKVREQTSNRLMEQLQGGLTGGEREEINRSVLQSNNQRGIGNVGSAAKTVENAMQYGSAATNRINSAIDRATQFLPGSRSGVQFNAQSLRPSQPNIGQSQFMGARTSAGDQATGFSGNLLNNIGGIQQAGTTGRQMYRNPGAAETFGKVAGGIGSMFGGGKDAACCWIFLESYGGTIPWWVRDCRDRFYTESRRNGYRRMSRFLIPLMRRSAVVREVVYRVMVEPLTKWGGWYHSVPGFAAGKQCYGAVKFWFKTWDLIGRI